MHRFVELLDRHARPRAIAAAFLAGLACLGFLFGYAVPRIRGHSPDAVPLDVLASYTPDEAYRMISLYGDDVRSFYVVNAFTADAFGPGLMALGTVLLSFALLRRAAGPKSRWRLPLLLAGVLGLCADLIENALLSVAVSRFPERADGFVRAAVAATTLKRAAVFSTWGALLLLVLAVLVRRVGARKAA